MTAPTSIAQAAALEALVAASGSWAARIASLEPAMARELPQERGGAARLYFLRAADMAAHVTGDAETSARVSARVRHLALGWLDELRSTGGATSAAATAMATMPDVMSRTVWAVSDVIWRRALEGKPDDGLAFYTRRGLLASILGGSLLYQLGGRDRDEVAAFLDRRLADTARLGRLRRRG